MKRRHSLSSIGMLLVGGSIIASSAIAKGTESNGVLHEKTLRLPNGNLLTFEAENVGGYSVAESDILLGLATPSNTQQQNRGSGIAIATSRWYDGIVPFQFSSELADSSAQTRARQAVEHWNRNSSIRLVERTPNNADGFKDYLEFTKSNGCASYVGRLGGRQEIWVSDTCSTGSMIHEIGHALGLLHEHTRNDRDQFIMVNYRNIVEGKGHNFAIPNANGKDYGDYDYASIMHYGAYFFSKNGSPTISPTHDITGIDMGQRNLLSDGDLAAISSIYKTDLALKKSTPENITAQQSFYINLDVINQGEQGANELMIFVPMKSSNKLVSFDGQGWECKQEVDKVLCGRASLIEYSQSSLTLNFESGYEPPDNIKVSLCSRTADFDLSNNGDILADSIVGEAHRQFFEDPLHTASGDERPALGAALAADGSGAGGVLYWLNFILLGLIVVFRKPR